MSRHTYPFTLLHPADAGGCGYYRMIWPATEMLRLHKMNGLVTDKLFDANTIGVPNPEIIITQRQYYDHQLQVLREYRKSGARVFYELDDDIMHVPNWSIHHNQIPVDIIERLKVAFKNVDKLIVTTQVLADELRKVAKGKPIHIMPNYLPPVYRTTQPYKHDGAFRIGWAGALAHKNDLALLLPIMKHFGNRVEWVFMGLLPENIPSGCIVHEVSGAVVPDYPKAVNALNLDVGVIPLEDNKLNRSKSGIKVLEMGIGGCAMVAIDMEPYQGFKNVIRVKQDPKYWIEVIEDLLKNRDKAWEMGQALRDEIFAEHMLDANLNKVAEAWEQTAYSQFPARTSDDVTIVIPCQKGGTETEQCFKSVLNTLPQNKAKASIVVVDDRADPDVKKIIKEYKHHFKDVIEHMSIKGFSGSVNDGMLKAGGDVILLNSDTEVYTDWIDRLKETADAVPQTASVTPFSTDNSYLGVKVEASTEHLDEIVATYFRHQPVEVVTPIGYCMYIKHEALCDNGLFDNVGYPRAYGEENDWGCIAALHGWKHLLAPSIVIKHLGGRSTGDATQLKEQGYKRVCARYPFYQKLSAEAQNLLVRGFKAALELRSKEATRPAMLMVSHTQGGGLETYVQRMSKLVEAAGWDVYIARPSNGNILIENPKKSFKHMLPISTVDMTGAKNLSDTLHMLNCKLIHVSTLVEYPMWMGDFLVRVSELSGIPFDVTVHEAYYWCPQLYMTQQNVPDKLLHRFCDSKDIETCANCTHNGSVFGFVNIEDWRAKNYRFLNKARHIYTTSEIYKDFVTRFVPAGEFQIQTQLQFEKKIRIRPHTEETFTFQQQQGNAIAVIAHNLLPLKGLEVVKKLIKAMPMTRFVIFGNVPQILPADNVVFTGPYKSQEELDYRVKFHGCALSLQLSIWPEVWMYSLTDSLRVGLKPVIFDIGVQAERLKKMGVGCALPTEWLYGDHTTEIAEVLSNMLAAPIDSPTEITGISYGNILKDYYEL